MPPRDPFQPLDNEVLARAQALLRLGHAALAHGDPAGGGPGISRIALGLDLDGCPLTLVSMLAAHGPALRALGDCALLVGEVKDRGDPLAQPRLMLRARAQACAAGRRAELRAHWLKGHPKAALYVDLGDFHFFRLEPISAVFNSGFGRAYRIEGSVLCPGVTAGCPPGS